MKPTSLVLAALLALLLAGLRRRLSGIQLGVGALVAAGIGLNGTGLARLPDLEEAAKDVGPSLGTWTYLVVGALAFLETAFFFGLVAPGELAVVLGGFVAGQGEIDVFVLAGVVAVCATAGDTTSFFLGRGLGRAFLLRHGSRLGLTGERLDQVERFFRSHGAKTILIGRFVGLIRALAPFVAGAARVPPRRFLPVDYLAAALWTATFVSLGYVFWRSFDTVVALARRGTLALGAVVFAIVLAVAAARWLESRANRARLRRAWRSRSLKPLREKA